MSRKLTSKHRFLTGQALLELAIFGSFLIMLLGVLVNYGLKFNYQQKIMQDTFRYALFHAERTPVDGKPISVKVSSISDRYLPDPQEPGAFSVAPFSSTASVMRNYSLYKTADKLQEAPVTILYVQGREWPRRYRHAIILRYPYENGLQLAHYHEIYGEENIRVDYANDKVNIINYGMGGELLTKEEAAGQCRMIVDRDACLRSCREGLQTEKELNSDLNGNGEIEDNVYEEKSCNLSIKVSCEQICDAPIKKPFYCQQALWGEGCYVDENNNGVYEPEEFHRRWYFPVIEVYFKEDRIQGSSYGMQPQDFRRETSVLEVQSKNENNTSVSGSLGFNKRDTIRRRNMYVHFSSEDGDFPDTHEEIIGSQIIRQGGVTRETPH